MNISARILLSIIFLFFFSNIFSQEKKISGKISDENNEELPGATIIIKGTTKGTVSDINGNYELIVQNNDTITISQIESKKDTYSTALL